MNSKKTRQFLFIVIFILGFAQLSIGSELGVTTNNSEIILKQVEDFEVEVHPTGENIQIYNLPRYPYLVSVWIQLPNKTEYRGSVLSRSKAEALNTAYRWQEYLSTIGESYVEEIPEKEITQTTRRGNSRWSVSQYWSDDWYGRHSNQTGSHWEDSVEVEERYTEQEVCLKHQYQHKLHLNDGELIADITRDTLSQEVSCN